MSRSRQLILATLGLVVALEMGCLSGYLFMLATGGPAIGGHVRVAAVAETPEIRGHTPAPTACPTGTAMQTPGPMPPSVTSAPATPSSTTVVLPIERTSIPTPPPTYTPVPTPTATRTATPTATAWIVEAHRGPGNAIIIIWDGTQRRNLLEMLYNAELPNLRALINQSQGFLLPTINSPTCQPGTGDGYRPETGPANSAIATGLGYPGMANWTNTEPRPIPDGVTLWEWFDGQGYVTGLVSSKAEDFWPQVPLGNARVEIDYWRVGDQPQLWVTENALEFIRSHPKESFFLWVHYREPDTLGHRLGENSPEYSDSLETNDQALGRLVDELRSQGIEDHTVLVVTTDHGFDEGGFQHDTCSIDTKHLFLATSSKGARMFGCIGTQTDIAPCLKAAVQP